ncbi:hypothetical protein UlMin_033907 [Ulmus minor]
MRLPHIFLLFQIVFGQLTGCFSESEISETSISKPSKLFNSLLPPTPKNDVAVVVDLEGKIYLVDTISKKILWSLPSGWPIYSSYQTIPNNESGKSKVNGSELTNDFFIDCGDDWELYLHSKRFGKVKVPLTAEEYVRSTPYVSDDGGVTLGSRKTTAFLVDAKSGKLIRTYKLADPPSASDVYGGKNNPILLKEHAEEVIESGAENLESFEQLLYIMRTDYALQHYSPDSGEILWNVAFADFDASFWFPSAGNELGAKYRDYFKSPLSHHLKPAVLRVRDHSLIESLSVFDRVIHGLPGGRPLSLPAPNQDLVPVGFGQIPITSKSTKGRETLALPSPERENPQILADGDVGILIIITMAETIARFLLQNFIPFLLSFLFMGFILYRYFFKKKSKLNKAVEESKGQVGNPKKKKTRRLGNRKNSGNNENPKGTSSNRDADAEGREIKSLLTFGDIVDGRRIGKLFFSNKEIAKGSNGTIVLEGIYDGRSVAVKRLVRTHHDVALKEIQNLITADQHPNIVRWYGVEYDQDFVYLSLERCTCSLNDLIFLRSESFQSQIISKDDDDSDFSNEYTLRLHSIMKNNKDIELWKANGYPTPQLLKLMRDVVSGVDHLHDLGIIHRDLKPQNVLINMDRSLSAKLSDMGISKRLPGDRSSITLHATGSGSSGWQAPEQLRHQRQTRAVDLFSLGCVLFFCITGGQHPYGDKIERDVNIVNDRKDLFLVESMPEALDLFTRLLDPIPDMRPKAEDVLHHPFFWSSEMRLSFLRDASDRVELEDRETDSQLLNALEGSAAVALNGKWDEKMEAAFINNIGHYRRYKYDSVRDLLRVIRNKLNHYRELPPEIQELLGPVPEGFDDYFYSRFPKLLIEVYKVMHSFCRAEEFFQKYVKSKLI